MAKYKCPTYGDCDRANAGETFERSPGEDLKCPGCGTLLELQATQGVPSRKKPVVAIVAGLVLVLVSGAGWYLMRPSANGVVPEVAEETAAASAPIAMKEASTAAVSAKLLPSEAETQDLRKEGDAQLANGDTTAAEQASNKAVANEMLKVAVSKLGQGKLEEAEKELREVLVRNPGNSLAYYNMAVLRLKQGKSDEAMREMEASFVAGFSHFDLMDKDADLDGLRKDARFQKLVLQYRPVK